MAKKVNKELKDIFEKGRSFEKEDGTVFYIVPPEAEEVRKANWHYSKIYNQAFVDGVTTVAEMRDALIKRGLLGEGFDDKAESLRAELDSLLSEMSEISDKDEKRILASRSAEKRDEIASWNQRASAPLSQTCESLADDARVEYLTSCMVRDESGNRVWDSYDEYVETDDQDLALLGRFEVMLFLQGLDSDFMSQLPERLVLDAEDDEVETDEEPEVEESEEDSKEDLEDVPEDEVEEEKSQKKTTSKRTTKKK